MIQYGGRSSASLGDAERQRARPLSNWEGRSAMVMVAMSWASAPAPIRTRCVSRTRSRHCLAATRRPAVKVMGHMWYVARGLWLVHGGACCAS